MVVFEALLYKRVPRFSTNGVSRNLVGKFRTDKQLVFKELVKITVDRNIGIQVYSAL